jgi:hypothetical protein
MPHVEIGVANFAGGRGSVKRREEALLGGVGGGAGLYGQDGDPMFGLVSSVELAIRDKTVLRDPPARPRRLDHGGAIGGSIGAISLREDVGGGGGASREDPKLGGVGPRVFGEAVVRPDNFIKEFTVEGIETGQ